MKRFVLLIVASFTLAFVSLGADEPSEEEAAQLTGSCGEIKNRNTSSQFGDYLWLEYIVETARPMNSFDCPWLSVSVEAWVVNVAGSAASHTGPFTASVRRQIPVPHAGNWQTNGRHHRNYLWYFSYSNGETSSSASISDEQGGFAGGSVGPEACPDPETPCNAPGDGWGGQGSPILIDVERNGYRLTSLDEGVLFDLDADGSPELVSWTRAQSDDAFLAMDRNGNGRIDDGSELFGNYTPIFTAGPRITAANGFEALKFLEGPSYGQSQRDEKIDGNDAAFSRLVLWTDDNHNGLSEPEELQPVTAMGLRAIDTQYKASRKRDRFGNEFRQRARVTWERGQEFVYDIWLLRRP